MTIVRSSLIDVWWSPRSVVLNLPIASALPEGIFSIIFHHSLPTTGLQYQRGSRFSAKKYYGFETYMQTTTKTKTSWSSRAVSNSFPNRSLSILLKLLYASSCGLWWYESHNSLLHIICFLTTSHRTLQSKNWRIAEPRALYWGSSYTAKPIGLPTSDLYSEDGWVYHSRAWEPKWANRYRWSKLPI